MKGSRPVPGEGQGLPRKGPEAEAHPHLPRPVGPRPPESVPCPGGVGLLWFAPPFPLPGFAPPRPLPRFPRPFPLASPGSADEERAAGGLVLDRPVSNCVNLVLTQPPIKGIRPMVPATMMPTMMAYSTVSRPFSFATRALASSFSFLMAYPFVPPSGCCAPISHMAGLASEPSETLAPNGTARVTGM